MSRRRSFRSEGPRSNAPPKRRAPRPGTKPRPGPTTAHERAQMGPPRHESEPKPRLFKDSAGADAGKQERLQKVLAHAGLGSRRGCEELVLQGRVSINGEIVRQLGTRVDPAAPDHRRRRADPARVDRLLRRQQAQGLRFDQLRPVRAVPASSTCCPRFPSGSTRSAGWMRPAPADDPDQ